jgi:hypothetical protein
MRFLPALILLGSFVASPLMAQRGRVGRIGPPVNRPGLRAPQLPPGTYLNGVPGPQAPPGLNGLPAFSNRIYHFGCFGNNCNSGRGGRFSRSNGGFVPLFGGYAFPSYLPSVDDSFAPAPEPPPVDPTATMLTNEIDQLRGEVDRMKSQANQPPPAAPAVQEPVTPPPPVPATVIVLRDGRRLETSNYAIMNQILWNFSARPIQKIPVSSIDIGASEKANADRGVDFSMAVNSTK